MRKNAAYDDFASILDEGKPSKVKPYIIAILVVVAIGGGILYFVSRSLNGGSSVASTTINSAPEVNEELDQATGLSTCLGGTKTSNPVPETSDSNFYPKLLASYDAMLACYDKYPNASTASYRSSVEYARQSAIDASGQYKDTYLSQNSYSYTPSSSSSNSTSSNTTPTNTGANTTTKPSTSSQPSSTTPQPASGSTATTTPTTDPRAAGLSKCLADAKSVTYSSEAARQRAMQECYSAYTP